MKSTVCFWRALFRLQTLTRPFFFLCKSAAVGISPVGDRVWVRFLEYFGIQRKSWLQRSQSSQMRPKSNFSSWQSEYWFWMTHFLSFHPKHNRIRATSTSQTCCILSNMHHNLVPEEAKCSESERSNGCDDAVGSRYWIHLKSIHRSIISSVNRALLCDVYILLHGALRL